MYGELAGLFHLITAPEEYEEESAFYVKVFEEALGPGSGSLLELGSGGGNNASHMKARYAITSVDISPPMLDLSRSINPECEHIEGDMRTIRLGREFDGVFVHDAVMYMMTEDDLRASMETAFVHCRPGGAALFAPDCVKETFNPTTSHGGNDDGARGVRYLMWESDSDPNDYTYTVDFAFLIRGADGSIRVEHDRHLEAVYSRETWLRLFESVGFQARSIPFDHSEVETQLEVFLARKPA
jgi:SAM-dependent methyltransferase